MKGTEARIRAWLWAAILAAYSITVTWLLATGRMLLYLHPKMHPYVILAGMFLWLITGFQCVQAAKGRGKRAGGWSAVLFVIPLLLISVDASAAASPESLSGRTVYTAGVGRAASLPPRTSPKSDVTIGALEEAPSAPDETSAAPGAPNRIEASPVYVSDFVGTFLDAYYLPEAYAGKTIQVLGFVYRDPAGEPGAFLISRLLVSCCAADAQVAGFKCTWDRADTLPDGGWFFIQGRGEVETVYNPYLKSDEKSLVIRVTDADEIEPLESPYVYP